MPTSSRPIAHHRQRPIRALLVATAVSLVSLVVASCGGDSSDTAGEEETDRPAGSPAREERGGGGRPELSRTPPAGDAIDRHVEAPETPPEPVAWNDIPPAPPLEGPLAPNQLITDGEVYGADQLEHPEDITSGLDGQLYTGTGDGGIWRLATDDVAVTRIEQVASVPGPVLGMRPYSETVLVAAVVGHGLMAIDISSGESWVLSDRVDGNLIYFPDGLDVAEDGTIYFTEASTLYYPGFPYDMLDGRPRGRLLRYEPSTGTTDVLADDLYFANGVAVDPEETHALVAESWRYRITQVELGGDDEGTTSPFGGDLAAIPDNLHLDDQGRLWVGGSGIRSDVTDTLLSSVDLRRQLLAMSLEELRTVRAESSGGYGFAQVLSPEGEPVFSFHDPVDGYDVSALLSHDGFVTFGTITGTGVVRIPAPAELA